MTREHEYEVLKRHDVYVVRKVGTEKYATRCYDWYFGRVLRWWSSGSSDDAHEFRFKWRAILHAKSLEREARQVEKYRALTAARQSATEESAFRRVIEWLDGDR